MNRRDSQEYSQIPAAKRELIMDYFRTQLQDIVSLHTAMFDKLLFDAGQDVPLELAEVFEDTGNRYLAISESISRLHLQRPLKIEEHLHPGIEPAGNWIQAKFLAEPRIGGSEHLAEPGEDDSDRP